VTAGPSVVSWPELISGLLGSGSGDSDSVPVALQAAARMSRADGVVLVEWVRDRPSVLHAVGVPVALYSRLPDSATHIAARPVTVVALDAHRDLIAVRAAGAAPFAESDLPDLRAIAALLVRAQTVGRKEAADSLHRLSLEMVGTLDLDRVLLSTANAAARLLRSEVAGVFLAHGHGEDAELRMRCAVGHRSVETARLRIPAGRGIAGKVLATGHPQRVDNYATTTSITKDYLVTALEEGTQSGLAVPLRGTAGDIIGVLAVWRRRPSVFSEEDEEFLTSLAGLAAIGLGNARLYQQQLDSTLSLQAIQRELKAQLHISDEALQIHRRLTEIAAEGLDLSALAQAVHGVVGGRIIIVPESDRVPAQWPPPEPGATAEADLPREVVARHIRDVGPAEHIGKAGLWVTVPIEVANVQHGRLYALMAQPPSTRDVVTLEQAATICALLLGHEESLLSATARLRSEFVWDLLDGRISSDTDEAGRALALGFRLAFPARILLLRARGLRQLTRAENWNAEDTERARNWLSTRISTAIGDLTGNVVPVAHRNEYLVAILPAAETDPATGPAAVAKAAVGRSPFPSLALEAGVSRTASDIESLPGALREARVALSAVTPATGPVVVLDELGVLQFLIAPTGAPDLYRYAETVLGSLVSYDERHGSNLVATLDRWFDNGCNSSQTARSLHLHPKSLGYRLRRVTEISGLDLGSRETRLDLELALRILGQARDIHARAGAEPGS
jgi:sugar diacid utilization regulator/putative methionine-R-sulfoxide reductase with GAF domain